MDRWIEFHRNRSTSSRVPPREIPLTPKKYEFLSSREKSVDIPRIRVYIYIYIHSRLFDTIPFVERVLTYLEVFPRSQRLDPFVYRGAFVAGQIRASFKRYLRRARGRKERTSGLLSWHEIRATPNSLFCFSSLPFSSPLFFFLLSLFYISCFYILPSHERSR